jgi:DNA-directed RNA polymerase subunit RPC12/RpoP
VTLGMNKGTNAHGHMGWVTVRCRVCGRYLSITGQSPASRKIEVVYYCPNCAKDYGAYFCQADARMLKYRCPFCGGPLKRLTPEYEE